MAKFLFDREFQCKIIKLMHQDFSFLTLATSVVEASFFEDKVLIRFFQIICEYYKEYGKCTTKTAIINEIEKDYASGRIKDELILKFKELYDELEEPVTDAEYIKDEVIRFCRRQATRKAMLECASLTDSEDESVWDKIYSKIGEAVRVGTDANDQGLHYFRDYDDRIKQREAGDDRIIIPTGMPDIDGFLKGGPRSGQIGFFMAGSSVGKSLALSHVGKRAVTGGFKVVHYTLELSALEIADRYDACLAHVPFQSLIGNSTKISSELGKMHDKYGDSLVIKEYPTKSASVATIESHLINLINSGFKPHMIIVDYLDLLKPTTNYNDLYADLGSITGELRGLGAKYNCVVWTATQTNRSGYAMEIVDMEQVGDSLQKMMIADIVLAICMNKEERANNRARIFIAKNRNGPAKIERPIATDYERMRFYDYVGSQNLKDIADNMQTDEKEKTKKKKPVKLGNAPGLPAPATKSAPRRVPLKNVNFPIDESDT
jgi:replicative DNA helicase